MFRNQARSPYVAVHLGFPAELQSYAYVSIKLRMHELLRPLARPQSSPNQASGGESNPNIVSVKKIIVASREAGVRGIAGWCEDSHSRLSAQMPLGAQRPCPIQLCGSVELHGCLGDESFYHLRL